MTPGEHAEVLELPPCYALFQMLQVVQVALCRLHPEGLSEPM